VELGAATAKVRADAAELTPDAAELTPAVELTAKGGEPAEVELGTG
jgi:hypothetical protein